MRATNTNKMRQFSSLLNEHWKRKQRLKRVAIERGCQIEEIRRNKRAQISRPAARIRCCCSRQHQPGSVGTSRVATTTEGNKFKKTCKQEQRTKTSMIDTFRAQTFSSPFEIKAAASATKSLLPNFVFTFSLMVLAAAAMAAILLVGGQNLIQQDPRPTIYSGQVSFGLLLSAHSSFGSELSASASNQVHHTAIAATATTSPTVDVIDERSSPTTRAVDDDLLTSGNGSLVSSKQLTQHLDSNFMADLQFSSSSLSSSSLEAAAAFESRPQSVSLSLTGGNGYANAQHGRRRAHDKRQIFERKTNSGGQQTRQQQHQQQQAGAHTLSMNSGLNGKSAGQSNDSPSMAATCGQANPNALYAGMGAIWASHQANLVGDSPLAIGTYVYDSCNDLDVGQRQSVRIVSNLNAFQQTTCESPRGSPISLTIAHGENQLRAIQLLSSFRVPVITTKEHFALEDYNQLTREQKRFLFTTAPSSRHLAIGALRFSKRIVARSASSPKLANQFYKLSPKNALIMISRNLPARFITYLTEMIPSHVNYEMLQSSQPIDQIRSVEALESILVKNGRMSPPPDDSSMAASSPLRVNHLATAPTIAKQFSPQNQQQRTKRNSENNFEDSDLSSARAGSGAGGEFESGSAELDSQTTKMLSPTIVMFITPSEAIDLVTRLRNDLAEVSRYYSLIVVTREDISPALKTIFRRGGSRLCSGKAFYTISPKPDDIGEFSRYFKDTVQMEGDTSDHPLICEFAKYQATSKIGADLDDISTEPVIKAVWSAAAAFKYVHKRECASLASSASSSSSSSSSSSASLAAAASSLFSNRSGSGGASSEYPSRIEGRTMNARQQAATASKSAHSECMIKMNKNMSNLVQRALKRLDVTINSTGLQALDGFRLKFDDLNELMTNKFSIKYINKECEITELGQYSGLKDSALSIDEDSLMKSLESTVPEPWPVTQQTTQFSSPTTAAQPSSSLPAGSLATSSASTLSSPTSHLSSLSSSPRPASSSGDSSSDSSDASSDSDRSTTLGPQDSSSAAPSDSEPSEEEGPSGADEKGESEENEQRKQQKKRNSKQEAADGRLAKRKIDSESNGKRQHHNQLSVTALGGRATMPGLTDPTEPTPSAAVGYSQSSSTSKTPPTTTTATIATTPNAPTATLGQAPSESQTMEPSTRPPTRPMRRLKPFPTTTGTTLSDWLPSGTLGGELSLPPTTTTATQVISTSPPSSTAAAANTRATGAGGAELGEPSQNSILSSVAGNSIRSNQQSRDDELIESGSDPNSPSNDGDLKMRGTTQAPTIVYSTLPESGGNADLELPSSKKTNLARNSTNSSSSTIYIEPPPPPPTATNLKGKLLDTAASTDFVTAASVSKSSSSPAATTTSSHQSSPFGRLGLLLGLQSSSPPLAATGSSSLNYLKDLESTPTPLSPPPTSTLFMPAEGGTATTQQQRSTIRGPQLESSASFDHLASDLRNTVGARSRLRSHLKWIYSSWFALAILAANICGALMTLYVLTFLLMKNCDGSLDRERQGIRSMHLLAIIMVFFGSTLFIVYPTPGLCLLRSSWQNFALAMLFGSLLLQSMQTRSLSSLGLGGRPNRLNQFLTLMFMVGVQLAYELQRLKYESANYLSFVNQHFGATLDSSDDNKKLLTLSSAIANQFNPLNSFNDQVTPVSIQVSEQYQNLLQDYCIQHPDDFLHSQIYLSIIVGLLVIFSASNRKIRSHSGATTSAHHKLASALTSGKLVASQHEANLDLSPSHPFHHQYSSSSGANGVGGGGGIMSRERDNVFMVTLISVPIYSIAVVLHIYGQNPENRDLISSVTLVLIAFVALACLFLPILLQIYHFEGIRVVANVDHHLSGSLSRAPMMTQSKLPDMSPSTMTANGNGGNGGSINATFTMFPEFAPNGLRRPSSFSGDSSSGCGGSRRPFAETKESRRKMGVSLANLGPSEDSLRSMGFCSSQRSDDKPIDPALLNLKLNSSANDELTTPIVEDMYQAEQSQHQHHNYQHQYHHQPPTQARRSKQGEKRLVMLDVDPCCPRHGLAAWPTTTTTTGSKNRRAINNSASEPPPPAPPCTSRGAKSRTPHVHQ